MVRVAVKGLQGQSNLDVMLVGYVLQKLWVQIGLAQLELLPTQQEFVRLPLIKPLVQIAQMAHLR